MKLTILTQFYPPDYAATGQLIEELATELGNKGLKVQVFSSQPSYAYEQEVAPVQEIKNGISVKRTKISRIWPERIRGRAVGGLLYSLRMLLKLRHSSRRGDLLLVTTEPPYLPCVAYLLNFVYHSPYICLIYDLYPDVAINLGVIKQQHWVAKIWHYCNRLTWGKAREIIVLTDTMKDKVLSHCPELEGKVHSIPNWFSASPIAYFAKEENWFAQKYNLDKVFTVLYSGNMGRCHDLKTVMETAFILRDKPVQFIFITRGAKVKYCQDFVAEHQLHNCLFLPLQPKENLPYSLAACDLSLVTIDANMEGLVAPSKLYGCLAAGRPIAVVCEHHSYLRKILAEARCGQAFDNGDAQGLSKFILGLMSQPEKGQEMGKRAQTYLLEHFTLQKISQDYYNVIMGLPVEALSDGQK
jgi:glycosyltransferase involved in cell wall biosynthesis